MSCLPLDWCTQFLKLECLFSQRRVHVLKPMSLFREVCVLYGTSLAKFRGKIVTETGEAESIVCAFIGIFDVNPSSTTYALI